MMKQRLQTSLGQQLVLTPQLKQALHLLQLSSLELEAEITEAVESNPLLEWDENPPLAAEPESPAHGHTAETEMPAAPEPEWDPAESWQRSPYSGDGGDGEWDATERLTESEDLRAHLAWQLHLSQLSPRDRAIGEALIDAIDDDGYLRTTFDDIVLTLAPQVPCSHDEILAMLRQVQRMDPVGVGA